MLPEVAWTISADGGDEPSEKIYVDLEIMAPVLAAVLRDSDEVYALISAELAKHGMHAQRVKISPDEPSPGNPPKNKTSGIGDILARMDQRAAKRQLKTIKRDDNSRRRVSKEERKTA